MWLARLIPGPLAFQRATLKNWEGPGDEAKKTLNCHQTLSLAEGGVWERDYLVKAPHRPGRGIVGGIRLTSTLCLIQCLLDLPFRGTLPSVFFRRFGEGGGLFVAMAPVGAVNKAVRGER